MRLRLNLQSFFPAITIGDTAAHDDNKRARELCAALEAGETAVFDKVYVDFVHLFDLRVRGMFWVTWTKGKTQYRVKKRF